MSVGIEKLAIIPTEGPLGAEVQGVDFSRPIDAEMAARLNLACAKYQVLLFR